MIGRLDARPKIRWRAETRVRQGYDQLPLGGGITPSAPTAVLTAGQRFRITDLFAVGGEVFSSDPTPNGALLGQLENASGSDGAILLRSICAPRASAKLVNLPTS